MSAGSSSEPPAAACLAAAREARRWLIGITISVVFGLFGVVMALLGYLEGTRPTAPAAAGMPAKHGQEPASARRERGSRERHK